MKRSNHSSAISRGERGIAALLLLFAMSAFSVLGIAAMTTGLGAAPPMASFTPSVAPIAAATNGRRGWAVRTAAQGRSIGSP